MKQSILPLFLLALGLASCGTAQTTSPTFYINDDGHLIQVLNNEETDLGLVKGQDGKDGINGLNGINGRDGVDGKDGADGKDGIDGQDGKDGRDGVNGKDGQDGRDGVDGKDGKDGSVIYIEVDKHITLSNPTTYAEVKTPGTHFDYLLVSNMSNNTAAGCYDSYVLPYEYEEMLGGTHNYMQYTNYSCFNYKEGEDYSQYMVNCTNRTAPGRYKDPTTGREYDWEDSPYGVGVYILTNANIYSCHQSTMCTYGGVPVSQVLITYDQAYTPIQLLESL